MYGVTPRFLETIRESHTTVAFAELYNKGTMIASLPIISGSVTDDSEALQRRRATIALPGTREVLNLLPDTHPLQGGLWPLGNEIRILAGLVYADASQELVSMGWFRISKPSIDDTEAGAVVGVDLYDHSRTVSRARFVTPYSIKQGTRYVDAIRDLIMSRMPTLTEDDFLFDEVPNYTTPQLTFIQDDDPWEMATNMAGSLGCELLWNGDRKVVLRAEPDPAVTPSAFDYVEGEDATFTGIRRSLDDENTYNGCIVRGESSSNSKPVEGQAWDTNPNSPTYFDPDRPELSEYGPVPFFITSEYVTTTQQAVQAAEANLLQKLGVVENVEFDGVVNFAHEANDVARIRRDRINIDNNYVLKSIQMGLGANDTQSASVKNRRVR